jgi:hypothetical protein
VCVCVLMSQMAHLNKIKSAEPEKLAELLSGKKTENVDPTEALQKAADDLIELKKTPCGRAAGGHGGGGGGGGGPRGRFAMKALRVEARS